MSIALSVVAPCLNEAKNLPELVDRLLRTFDRRQLAGEVVLVDDGSTDDTFAVMERSAGDGPGPGDRRPPSRQSGASCRPGAPASRRRAGGTSASSTPTCRTCRRTSGASIARSRSTGADLVQGYRSSIGRERDSRYVLSVGLNMLLNAALRDAPARQQVGLRHRRARDPGGRAAPPAALPLLPDVHQRGGAAKGYCVREIETLFQERARWATSFIDQVARCRWSCADFSDLAKGFVEFRLRRASRRASSRLPAGSSPRPRRQHRYSGWRRAWIETLLRHDAAPQVDDLAAGARPTTSS